MMPPETLTGVDVTVIAKAVQRNERKHGQCHPAQLVETARSERSPLHPLFTWDDTVAAGQWRTHQARLVINRIRVVVDEEAKKVAPMFVHVSTVTDEGVANGYMTAQKALASPARDQVLRDAVSQLAGLRRRYESLTELAPVWQALDELEQIAV